MTGWRTAVGTAALSALHAPAALFRGRLRWTGQRVGRTLQGPDGRPYRVFRETGRVGGPAAPTELVVIEARFRFPWLGRAGGLRHRLFQRVCIATFPLFSGLAGYRVKLWAVEADGPGYLGVYEWEGEDAARAYLAALLPLLRALSARGSVDADVIAGVGLVAYLDGHPPAAPDQRRVA